MRKRSDAKKSKTPRGSSSKSRGDIAEANKLARARAKADDEPILESAEDQTLGAPKGAPPIVVDEKLEAGDEISMTVGPETFTPIKYNSFAVGPLTFKSRVRHGETASEAFLRLGKLAEVLYRAEFEVRAKQYFDRLREVHDMRDKARVGSE